MANYFSQRQTHVLNLWTPVVVIGAEIPTAMRAEVIIGGYPKITTIFNIPGI